MATTLGMHGPRVRAVHRVEALGYGRALVSTRLRGHVLTATAPRRQRRVIQMGLFGLGAPELLVIAGVAALIFGPSKLPELGKGLGKTMKEVKVAAKEFQTEMQKGMDDEDKASSDTTTPSTESSSASSSSEQEQEQPIASPTDSP